MNFYAFDSFQGLPDLGEENLKHNKFYKPSALKTTEEQFMYIIKKHGLFLDKIYIIKGFYNETLNDDLKKELLNKNCKAAFITFDCNLDISYRDALNFSENFLQEGTILYLDDYRASYKGNPEKGVPAVFKRFTEKSQFKFEDFLSIGRFGKSFIAYK